MRCMLARYAGKSSSACSFSIRWHGACATAGEAEWHAIEGAAVRKHAGRKQQALDKTTSLLCRQPAHCSSSPAASSNGRMGEVGGGAAGGGQNLSAQRSKPGMQLSCQAAPVQAAL